MAEIMDASRMVSHRQEPLSWLRRLLRSLGRPQRLSEASRIDEQAWSGYMLRDIGLDEGRRAGGRGPRDLPLDWPLR